jgi:ProQ/FINO family
MTRGPPFVHPGMQAAPAVAERLSVTRRFRSTRMRARGAMRYSIPMANWLRRAHCSGEDGLTITKKLAIHAALLRLAECFPQTFVLEKHLQPQPLKVGIAADILGCCPDLDRRVLDAALRRYTSRLAYQGSLVAGAARVDLAGNPAGGVSAATAERAAAKLAEVLDSRAASHALGVARRARAVAKPLPAPVLPAPSAVKAVPKERPVLRLPAFRRG